MATEVPSQQEFYDKFKDEAQNRAASLTDFSEGSNLDAIGGATSVAAQELVKEIIRQFSKTFFSTANGPEVTGGPDDLENLAVDHFGDSFARPGATKATGTVAFTRPTSGAGNVSILAGTIVKTEKDANGEEQRFTTLSDVTLTGLTVNASVEAVVGGASGNAQAGTVIVLETALTDDTVVVANTANFVGGDDSFDDSEYREFIRNKIETLRGATKSAVEAAALNVPGVETATAIEAVQTVIEWDIGSSMPVGEFFFIPRTTVYVADANGTASDALIDNVRLAIDEVRACGVFKDIIGAVALPVDWTGRYVLNPGGPNFVELSSDASRMIETMEQYLRDLPIGTGFDKSLARLAMLDIWGPSGTNDITDFITDLPIASISATETQKIIPGTVQAGL